MTKMMFRRLAIGAAAGGWLLMCGARPASAQDVPAEYQAVLKSLGKGGDYKDSVLKVNIPRNDVRVTILLGRAEDVLHARARHGHGRRHRHARQASDRPDRSSCTTNGTGPDATLARGVRAAVDLLGKP
jgi:hypothetical protein